MNLMGRMNNMFKASRIKACGEQIEYNGHTITACPGNFFFRTEDISGMVIRTRCLDFIIEREILETIVKEPSKGDKIFYQGREFEVNAPSGEPVWMWSGTFCDTYRIHTTGLGEEIEE